MWASKVSDELRRYLDPVTKGYLYIGTAATVVILVLTVANVFSRKAVHIAVPGALEMVELAMFAVVFCTLAYTELRKGHVRVTLLIDKFSPTVQDAIFMGTGVVTLAIASIIGWQIIIETQRVLLEGAITGVLGIPRWPLVALVSSAFILFGLSILVNILEHLGKMVARGTRNYVWLVPGIVVTAALLATSFWPDALLPAGIGKMAFGGLALLVLFALLFLGTPVAICMGAATLWGFAYLGSVSGALSAISRIPLSSASTYIWSVVPMFVLMGIIVAKIGIAEELYTSFYKLFGRLRGGLAAATTGASTAFAAMVGDSLTSVMAMSRIALPSMLTRKYDAGLATGSIASGGTIGILIPPSIGFIIYGIMAEESIGKLFMAGILPGLLLSALVIAMTLLRAKRNPALGPAGGSTTVREKMVALKGLWSTVVLFGVVMGGLYSGFFTPTEAGAIGAFAAIIMGLSFRRLSMRKFLASLQDTMDLLSRMFVIFFFAIAFTTFIAISGIASGLSEAVQVFGGGSQLITLALILLLYLGLGCVMNALPVLIMTLPVILPLARAMGFDFIWLGVLLVIMAEVGMLTPPIGMNVYAMSSTCDVPMATIFKGVLPYWITKLVGLVILVFLPQICLFLPSLM